MKTQILTILLLSPVSLWAPTSIADTDVIIDPIYLKDPLTRNENISHAIVTANYTLRGDGNYEYKYTIQSPTENVGEIMHFTIDISCDLPRTEPLGLSKIENLSTNGKHIIVETDDLNYNEILGPGITVKNLVLWSSPIKPGETRTGMRFISNESPVLREYKLTPSWSSINWNVSVQ